MAEEDYTDVLDDGGSEDSMPSLARSEAGSSDNDSDCDGGKRQMKEECWTPKKPGQGSLVFEVSVFDG
jgi:hypothetical protein